MEVSTERLMQIIGTQHVEILLLREQVVQAQAEARGAHEMAARQFVCERPCCQTSDNGAERPQAEEVLESS